MAASYWSMHVDMQMSGEKMAPASIMTLYSELSGRFQRIFENLWECWKISEKPEETQ